MPRHPGDAAASDPKVFGYNAQGSRSNTGGRQDYVDRGGRVRIIVALACAMLAGCTAHGYDPPIDADHHSPEYVRALRQCSDPADLKARQTALATPVSSLKSLFTSEEPERREIRTCMLARGYKLRPGD
jgi:hypothetical protein